MRSAEIGSRWESYFASKDHLIVPSTSLVSPDPSILFTIAGMVPFIPYIMGTETPPYPRIADVQKCIRTNDIENVGKTTRHGTFFQMLGNWSFGDYFKTRAIELAWDLLTGSETDGRLGFDPDSLWVTVWENDEEAWDALTRGIGMDPRHIVKLPKEENFWSTGQPGPAGPCAEWHVDRGPEFGPEAVGGTVDPGGDRYLEIWNLVFNQFVRGEGEGKAYPLLGELEQKAVDTGAGLERIAYLKQGVANMYETDLVFPVIAKASDLSGTEYGHDKDDDVHLRVVADHTRSALMLIGDGVRPSNEGRGYVLRRLLRRTVRTMRLLGVDEPVLPELFPVARDMMGEMYPQVIDEYARISDVAYGEEEAFRRTLAAGTLILDTAVAAAKKAAPDLPVIGGAQAFALHDTYGFPIDLTLEMAAEQGVVVDEPGFRALMTEQRQRARADAQSKKRGHADPAVFQNVLEGLTGPVQFLGYTDNTATATLQAILSDSAPAPAATAPADIEIVLDRTPFYAESGGQLADHGTITFDSGAVVEVDDVQRPIPGLIVHRGRLTEGTLTVGDSGIAGIDVDRRIAIARAHTATHMVHKALHEYLGNQATQAGSENSPSRLRFDFRHGQSVPAGVLADIEGRVNERLQDNLTVTDQVMDIDAARAAGAMALFGEKYGRNVRVVSIGGDWSLELCAGTHVPTTGNLGLVTVLGEASIGSGVRRIDALVGQGAWGYQARERALVSQLSQLVGARPDDLPDRISGLLGKLKAAEKELAATRTSALVGSAASLASGAERIGDVLAVLHNAAALPDADSARVLAIAIRDRLPEAGVAVVVGDVDGRATLAVATNDAGRGAGLRAGALVSAGAKVLGGGGGGRDDVAQGGGTDPAKAADALAAIRSTIEAR